MSEEGVEAYRRGVDAFNRRDVEAFLREVDPEIELHASLMTMLGGEATVRHGHDGLREQFRDLGEAFSEFRLEITEIRDLDERLVAIGHLRGRGRASGAEVNSPIGYVVELKNGKAIRIHDYFDPDEALEAAGLSG